MYQEHNDHSEREVIDEQEVVDNLVEDRGQSRHQKQEMRSHRVIYTKQTGCFDIKSAIINLLVYTLVLLVTSGFFSGFYIAGLKAALQTAIVMSILNIILKPILVFVTLPLTIMTFGLFYIFINGILLLVADWIMGPTFQITSFSTAVFASIFISLLRMGINRYVLKDDRLKVN